MRPVPQVLLVAALALLGRAETVPAFTGYYKARCSVSADAVAKGVFHSKVEIGFSHELEQRPRITNFRFGVFYSDDPFGAGFKLSLPLNHSASDSIKQRAWAKVSSGTSVSSLEFSSYITESVEFIWEGIPAPSPSFDLKSHKITLRTSNNTNLEFICAEFAPFDLAQAKLIFWVVYLCFWLLQLLSLAVSLVRLVSNPIRNATQVPRITILAAILIDVYLTILLSTSVDINLAFFLFQFVLVIVELPLAILYSDQETEYRDSSDKKQFCWGCSTVAIIALFVFFHTKYPDRFPLQVTLLMATFILDNFVFAIETFSGFYHFGICLPKVLLVWSLYFNPNSLHMGPGNYRSSLGLTLVYLALLVICYLQARIDPRFFVRTVWIDNNEYLYRPTTVLLDELIKEQNIDQQEVCGICLVSINPDWAVSKIDQPAADNPPPAPQPETEDPQEEVVASVFQITKCGHIFHKECLETWNDTHDSCPICRKLVIN